MTFKEGVGSASSGAIVEALDSLSLLSSPVDPFGFFGLIKEERRRYMVSDGSEGGDGED